MGSVSNKTPLIVLVGETCGGKSALALKLAKQFDGEIICADSRTVYKGMNIGTAKPSSYDQELVPHHLIDIVEPSEPFTAAQFKELANTAIADVQKRGKVPIMVGGTGLYVDAVLFDYDFREKADPELRAELELLSLDELKELISEQGLELPNNPENPRHLMRVLESKGEVAAKKPMRSDAHVFGIEVARDELKRRVNRRTRQMIQDGLVDEAEVLTRDYRWDSPGMNAIGYRELKPFFDGLQTQEQTVLDIN